MMLVSYIASQFSNPRGFAGKISTRFMNTFNHQQYKAVMQDLPDVPGRILDIGFGNGRLLNKIAKKGYDMAGVEISESLIRAGEKRNTKWLLEHKIQIKLGSAQDLPFEKESFDAIYSINTIYFWENFQASCKEIKRCLKQNGVLILAFYEKEWLDRLSYTNYGFQKYTTKELVMILESNGFQIVSINRQRKDMSVCISAKIGNHKVTS